MKPIMIDRTISHSCFYFEHPCGGRSEAKPTVVIRIKRAGQARYQLEYPADIGVDGSVCFEWGEKFYRLPAGRYVGDIFENETKVDRVQFQLHPALRKVTRVLKT